MSNQELLTPSALVNGQQVVASYLRNGKNLGVDPIEEVLCFYKRNVQANTQYSFKYSYSDLQVNQLQSSSENTSVQLQVLDPQNTVIFSQTWIAQPTCAVIPSIIILPKDCNLTIKSNHAIDVLTIYAKQISVLCCVEFV